MTATAQLATPTKVSARGWAIAATPMAGLLATPAAGLLARTATGGLDDDVTTRLLTAAAQGARSLPAELDDALIHFADHSNRAGTLLITDVPVNDLPPTPPSPDAPTAKDLSTELALLTVARRIGQPVGFAPEHGGRIVQNIVPKQSDSHLQMSTSSSSNLMFHTETAFHPHRPRHLALLCLRGNPDAHTTLASVFDLMEYLPNDVVDVMFEARFRTSVDASFLDGRDNTLGPLRPLISGTRSEPTFVFDADLTEGVDAEATAVVEQVKAAIQACQTSVVLTPGDLVVIDNNIAVHGRSPFAARFDGTDRWLQRSFMVSDLSPSAADRNGRVITTEFGVA